MAEPKEMLCIFCEIGSHAKCVYKTGTASDFSPPCTCKEPGCGG